MTTLTFSQTSSGCHSFPELSGPDPQELEPCWGGCGLGGDRRELAEQEQTILHSHVLQGGKHVLWPPRQSFLGSKTGRNPLNTTPQHKAAFAKNLALA